ncbi:MAG: dienelactone hydrolase family protein [Alphaproteobacteria bacterium]
MRAVLATCALAVLLGGQARAAEGEAVTFPSVDWSGAVRAYVSASLFRPAAPGRHPAVVILHGCGGVRASSAQWGEWLAANGMVALALDSFGPRGLSNVCGNPPDRAFLDLLIGLVEDSFSAASFLAARPEVDRTRIAAMGFSLGGHIVRRLGGEDARSYAPRSAPQFRALLPFYPGGCGIAGRDVRRIAVPMLILHGELDDWTPAAPCREAAARARARGEPVDIVVYSAAHHGFDQVDRPLTFLADVASITPERRMGVHIGGNTVARDAARLDVLRFLRANLAPDRPPQ